MCVSFWNTLRWFVLLMWAVKAAPVQRRVHTSQDLHWSQDPCVPDTAVRVFCFPSKQDWCCSGNREYSNPCPFFKPLVLCLYIHLGIVCDGDRDVFRAPTYIWSPSNCCNHSSGRDFLGASAQKGVWGSWAADLESSSHLPPVTTSQTNKISLLHYWGLNLKGQVDASVFSDRQYWTSSISFIFLVNCD